MNMNDDHEPLPTPPLPRLLRNLSEDPVHKLLGKCTDKFVLKAGAVVGGIIDINGQREQPLAWNRHVRY